MEQNLKTLLGEAIEPYDSEIIKPGVICYTTVPYVPQKCDVIEPLSYDTASHKSKQYKLSSMGHKQLQSYLYGSKLPNYELGIRSNEILLAYRVKLRPIVVMTPCLSGKLSGFPSYLRYCVLCAPLYTLVDIDGNLRQSYNPNVIKGIVALKYSLAFPILTSPYMNSKISALMLNRIQPAQVCALSRPHLKVRNKWLAYIREWIRFYATGRLGEKKKPESKETVAQFLDGVRAVLSDA